MHWLALVSLVRGPVSAVPGASQAATSFCAVSSTWRGGEGTNHQWAEAFPDLTPGRAQRQAARSK